MEQIQKKSCDIFIKGCIIALPDLEIIEDGAIAISGDTISAVGDCVALEKEYESLNVVFADGKLAMPGMYDCHAHSVQQLLKGGTVDEPPIVWRRILVPYEAGMNAEDRYHASRLYCVQALKAGITMFADAGSMDMAGTVQAVQETGIRAAIARVGRDMDTELPSCMVDKSASDSMKAMEALYLEHHGGADGRIKVFFSLSSPMSSSAELVKSVGDAARHYDTRIHIHLGEHPAEVQTCLERWGKRPPEFFAQYGALGPNVIAAHCIRITDFDIHLMAECGLNVIHCPTANLSSQDVPKLLAERAAGLNIALGNDGAHAARQDILAQMQLLKYVTQPLQGTPQYEPNVLPLSEGFDMMTRNGARALGVEDKLGTLEVNKIADIVLLDINDVAYLPTRNLMKTLLMCAGSHCVSDVMVGGQWLIRNREFTHLDEEEIMASGQRQLNDMLGRVG